MHRKFIESSLDVETISGEGQFEGYASVFDHTDSVHDRVVRGAFKNSLDRYRQKQSLPPLLWQHDSSEPIGVWREMYEDHHGLFVRGELFIKDIPRARQAYKLITEKGLSGLSIGFKALESYRDQDTGARVLTEIDLLEVSLVTFPALESARVSQMKAALQSGKLPDERSLEAFLRDAGFSRKQAKSFIAAGYKSLGPRDAGEVSSCLTEISALQQLSRQLYALAAVET
jgi:HK97 family phage prohead protease